MEYRRAYWDEEPDAHLVARHERELAPLLQRRHLFAEVEHFLLYDFFALEGQVNEDVFAYSNRSGDERGLVIYHNKYATARGWIKTSVSFSVKAGEGERTLVNRTLGQGLGLQNDGRFYVIFRDHVTGLEYIRNSQALWNEGLYFELEAYKYHVFVDWREVEDDEWGQYAHLSAYLNGRGVPSIEEALREVFLQPVHRPFRELVNGGHLRWLADHRLADPAAEIDAEVTAEAERRMVQLLQAVRDFGGGQGEPAAIAREVCRKLEVALQLPVLAERLVPTTLPGDEAADSPRYEAAGSPRYGAAAEMIGSLLDDDLAAWGTLLSWVLSHAVGKAVRDRDAAALTRSWMDEWLLNKVIAGALQDLGLDEGAAWWAVGTVKILVSHQNWCDPGAEGEGNAYQVLSSWLEDGEVQQFLQINRHQGVLWFNHESFEALLGWMLAVAAVEIGADPDLSPREVARQIAACYELIEVLQRAEAGSEYRVDKLLEAVQA
jgi:hypothetical protein